MLLQLLLFQYQIHLEPETLRKSLIPPYVSSVHPFIFSSSSIGREFTWSWNPIPVIPVPDTSRTQNLEPKTLRISLIPPSVRWWQYFNFQFLQHRKSYGSIKDSYPCYPSTRYIYNSKFRTRDSKNILDSSICQLCTPFHVSAPLLNNNKLYADSLKFLVVLCEVFIHRNTVRSKKQTDVQH